MTADSKARSRLQVTAVAVLALVGATGVVVQLNARDDQDLSSLRAVFTDASPLLVGNEVKVDGVKVGVIEDIGLEAGQAVVDMSLEPAALPIHSDARATIRPVSLLGERYIDLDRGSPDAPALDGDAVIPVEQTSRNTDLDEVLNSVDRPTGKALAALVATLGDGMQGNGRNVRRTIAALAPAMGDVRGLLAVLDEQNRLLTDVIDSVEPVADALATDEGRTMDQLVSSAEELLGAAASRQEDLEAALRQLPSTLQQARATLAELAGTAGATTPTLRALRPTTDNLKAISAELERFAGTAGPALAQAEPVLRKAQQLLDRAQPVAAELRKAGPDVASSARSADAVVTELTQNIDGLMAFIKNWALSSNGHDGVSHYFRALVVGTTYTATGAIPRLPGAGPSAAAPSKGGGSPPKGPLAGLTDLAQGLLGLKPQRNGGVTGLTQQQETDLLGFLLGGL